MTLRTLALALAATLSFGGAAIAADAMSTPMAPADAMAPMAGDAMAPMDADQMLADCLVKAGTEMDAMKKDEATKACHDDAMGAMAADAMAPAADAMATDAMAPATK